MRDRITVGRSAAAVLAALFSLAGVLGIGSSTGAMAGRGPAQAAGSSLASVAPGASGRLGGTRLRADAHPVRHGRDEAAIGVGGPTVSHAVPAPGPAPGPVPGVVTATSLRRPQARQWPIIRRAAVRPVAGVPRGAVPGRAPPHLTGS